MSSKSRPVPDKHLDPADGQDFKRTPELEQHHVHEVYNQLATQWAGTRYKAWPEVERFFQTHAQPNSLVGEIGCGNGKNLRESLACTGSPLVIASDVSFPLCEIAALQTPKADIHVADIISLPMRSEVFDLGICIAVLHHLSTQRRRLAAVQECARVMRPGAKLMFLAWAQEQQLGVSGHEFAKQDVFVPFHQKTYQGEVFPPAHVDEEIGHGVLDLGKRSLVYQRYCHVFVEGELEQLVESCGNLKLVRSFTDAGNWGVVCEKQ
ncbi:hypothetical protein BASA81_001385 [Batrachochytrium salamandrivorans]|nr:hypothetical protein BASA81_001385 [Batrachochytrium salamandrivorans]